MAALVFALLAASLTAVHALPCPDSVTGIGASRSGAVDGVGVHGHDAGRKATGMNIDRCCQMSCSVCVSVVPPAAGGAMALAHADHPLLAGMRLAGITAGPPHGPPRS